MTEPRACGRKLGGYRPGEGRGFSPSALRVRASAPSAGKLTFPMVFPKGKRLPPVRESSAAMAPGRFIQGRSMNCFGVAGARGNSFTLILDEPARALVKPAWPLFQQWKSWIKPILYCRASCFVKNSGHFPQIVMRGSIYERSSITHSGYGVSVAGWQQHGSSMAALAQQRYFFTGPYGAGGTWTLYEVVVTGAGASPGAPGVANNFAGRNQDAAHADAQAKTSGGTGLTVSNGALAGHLVAISNRDEKLLCLCCRFCFTRGHLQPLDRPDRCRQRNRRLQRCGSGLEPRGKSDRHRGKMVLAWHRCGRLDPRMCWKPLNLPPGPERNRTMLPVLNTPPRCAPMVSGMTTTVPPKIDGM